MRIAVCGLDHLTWVGPRFLIYVLQLFGDIAGALIDTKTNRVKSCDRDCAIDEIALFR